VQAVHGYVETASVIAVLNDADRTSDDIVGVPLYRTQLKVSSTVVQQLHYIHLFNGPFSGTTRVSRFQKGKTNLFSTETVSGSGISWAVCKSAPCSRQITMPAPHHSVFTGRMPFLPPNQQRQSTEGNRGTIGNKTRSHRYRDSRKMAAEK